MRAMVAKVVRSRFGEKRCWSWRGCCRRKKLDFCLFNQKVSVNQPHMRSRRHQLKAGVV
jgi:hypothetical protein